jgi:hypothetical protein
MPKDRRSTARPQLNCRKTDGKAGAEGSAFEIRPGSVATRAFAPPEAELKCRSTAGARPDPSSTPEAPLAQQRYPSRRVSRGSRRAALIEGDRPAITETPTASPTQIGMRL